MDVASFFASLDHDVVLETLARLVKDRRVLELTERVVRGSTGAREKRGLPIGSLTSQWLANLTLSRLDHLVLGAFPGCGYVRYMDDFMLFGDDARALHGTADRIAAYLRDPLRLALKERATRVVTCSGGVPFLGFAVFPGIVRLRPENLRRMRARLRTLHRRLARGWSDSGRYRAAVQSVLAHAAHWDTLSARRAIWKEHALEL